MPSRLVTRSAVARALPSAVAVAAIAALAGCSSGTAPTSASSPSAASAANATADGVGQIGNPTSALCDGKSYTIGFDAFSVTGPGLPVFLTSMEALAHKLGCVKIISTVNNVDPATALQNARTFVTEHVNAVILFSAITATATGELKVLKAANIPVVQFGAVAPGSPELLAPEFDAGTLAGTQLAKIFIAAHPGQVPYLIAGLNTPSGQPYIGYMANFVKAATGAFSNFPSSHVIQLEAGTDPTTAQGAVRDVLSKVPASAPVILMGDDTTITAAMLQTVLQQQGRSAGNVYAIDGRGSISGDKSLVCGASQWVGMVNYQFENWADYTVPLAILQAQGKTVPQSSTTQINYLTRSQLCGS
jgi:ABC-type sugar transport system substrate-binding protein